MQVGHTILTLDMTFKEPLVIKEASCRCKMGFFAAQQPHKALSVRFELRRMLT